MQKKVEKSRKALTVSFLQPRFVFQYLFKGVRAVFRKVFLGGNSPKVFLGKVVVFGLFKPLNQTIYCYFPSSVVWG